MAYNDHLDVKLNFINRNKIKCYDCIHTEKGKIPGTVSCKIYHALCRTDTFECEHFVDRFEYILEHGEVVKCEGGHTIND